MNSFTFFANNVLVCSFNDAKNQLHGIYETMEQEHLFDGKTMHCSICLLHLYIYRKLTLIQIKYSLFRNYLQNNIILWMSI